MWDRSIAPLASSETFSDVLSICPEEPNKTVESTNLEVSTVDEKSNLAKGTSDFDSLEILFDFNGNSLTTDGKIESGRLSKSLLPIRSSLSRNMNNTTMKVRRKSRTFFRLINNSLFFEDERKSLRFEISDSSSAQKQRLRLDSQSNQTTCQNVQLLSKKTIFE